MAIKKNSKNEIWDIDKLFNWDKNPRSVKTHHFKRLLTQIEKLGQYKPLIITPKGEVIGGNMRLRAYDKLGIKKVWVSIVNPKDEKEKIEYAMSDNDEIGQTDEELLAELLSTIPDVDLDLFHVSSNRSKSLQEVIDQFSPTELDTHLDKQDFKEMKVECPECGHPFNAYDETKT